MQVLYAYSADGLGTRESDVHRPVMPAQVIDTAEAILDSPGTLRTVHTAATLITASCSLHFHQNNDCGSQQLCSFCRARITAVSDQTTQCIEGVNLHLSRCMCSSGHCWQHLLLELCWLLCWNGQVAWSVSSTVPSAPTPASTPAPPTPRPAS